MSAQRHSWVNQGLLVQGYLLYRCSRCRRWHLGQRYLFADSQEEAARAFRDRRHDTHAGPCVGEEEERHAAELLRQRGWTCIPPEGGEQ